MADRMVKWLKGGGFLFLGEYSFNQSVDFQKKNSPTRYHEPRFYTKVRLSFYYM